jgi:hypothetical protein
MKTLERLLFSVVLGVLFMATGWIFVVAAMVFGVLIIGEPADHVAMFLVNSTTIHLFTFPVAAIVSLGYAWQLLDNSTPSLEKIDHMPCMEWEPQLNKLAENGEQTEALTDHLADCVGCERHVNKLLDLKLSWFDDLAKAIRRKN